MKPKRIYLIITAATALAITLYLLAAKPAKAARGNTITIDDSPAGHFQTIDGFGTCHGNPYAAEKWYQDAYYVDLGASIMRMDLVPHFKSPYSDRDYNCPWYDNAPPLKIDDPANTGGPDHNNVRTYHAAGDYTRDFAGHTAPIAIMGPDIQKNKAYFDFTPTAACGALARAGEARKMALGDFKLYGSIWSPAPWLKVTNGQTYDGGNFPMPPKGTPYPFIWAGNFAGGKLETSNVPLDVFNDGTGPTSALTQFARSTAAYVKGIQDTYGVHFYAISIQNELNFPEFYNSCVYRTAPEYIAALKAVRAEFDQHPDLKPIQIAGPEDMLGGDAWNMWQLGGSDGTTKNLKYLNEISQEPAADSALGFFCIHGYASDGATAAGADSAEWRTWADGWTLPPHWGLPANVKGFVAYHKKSWMTETSGEQNIWLAPKDKFPGDGAWSIALKTQQALTAGRESAILYWQFAEKETETTSQCLTQKNEPAIQPKYIAMRHFSKFIRPGAVAVKVAYNDSRGLAVSAFEHEQNGTLVVELVNKSNESRDATLAVPPHFQAIQHWDSYTSQEGQLWHQAVIEPNNQSLPLVVPSFGIMTVVGKLKP